MDELERALRAVLDDPAQLQELRTLAGSLGLGQPDAAAPQEAAVPPMPPPAPPPAQPPKPPVQETVSLPEPPAPCPPLPVRQDAGGLLSRLLPRSIDTGDLLMLLILLLLAVDGEEEDSLSVLLTAAAFLLS